MPLEFEQETPEQAAAYRDASPEAHRYAASLSFAAPPITAQELEAARPTPDCIVERLYYADVGNLIAPGGVGKTTLELFIAVHIALGISVFGERVLKPGPVMIITAEDSREILVARIRSIVDALGLDAPDRATVMDRVRDVSGAGFKLTKVIDDVVMPSGNLDAVIATARTIRPVLIVIDPAVSFGVGESRVNDAEQGLVEAARKMRNDLNCAVVYVHHSGKMNARDKTLDQYSGRGGSAFADGARMVHVLQPLTHKEWQAATGDILADDETGLILARPKMSYCPKPSDLYIRRRGYLFEHVHPASMSKAVLIERQANQLWQLLSEGIRLGRYHTKNTLEHAETCDLTRAQMRAALSWLEADGRLEQRRHPNAGQRGSRQYLHPVGSPGEAGEVTLDMADSSDTAVPAENANFASPTYRDMKRRRSEPPISSPRSLDSPASLGEPTANTAR